MNDSDLGNVTGDQGGSTSKSTSVVGDVAKAVTDGAGVVVTSAGELGTKGIGVAGELGAAGQMLLEKLVRRGSMFLEG